ncbi:MAG: SMP-30/gluconolactonase/LRE family protein [Alphaproteobacteria bacterium]|nr:SMP-30/gluconolactonase/LRE family protein [Alphaproteobacteria bacterium]
MVAPRVTCLVDARAQVGEGPVWDPAEGVLWWTDINGRDMHRFDPRTGRDEIFAVGVRVGCFALRASGGMILAAEHGFWTWTPGDGKPTHLIDVEADRPQNRMNDGGCDRAGNFFASSMHLGDPRRPEGACWRLTPDLRVERVAGSVHIGNGIAFSPDGGTFYFADTTAKTVLAHDYDARSGRVGPARIFADTRALAGLPDGATVDDEGGYWLAGVTGGQLYRFTPDGRLDRTIDVPISRPTRPMFGGPARDRIFLTSIHVAGEPLSGGLFVLDDVGARGLEEPRFAG